MAAVAPPCRALAPPMAATRSCAPRTARSRNRSCRSGPRRSATAAARRFRGVSGFNHSYSSDGFNWTLDPHEWDVPAEPLCIGDWGSGGGDTQASIFYDPPCQCFSMYTRFKNVRPRPPPWFRMVRRVRSRTLEGAGSWVNQSQSMALRADALDNASHPVWQPDFPVRARLGPGSSEPPAPPLPAEVLEP